MSITYYSMCTVCWQTKLCKRTIFSDLPKEKHEFNTDFRQNPQNPPSKAVLSKTDDKICNDKNFAAKFEDDPVKPVESVLGVDLPDDKIESVVDDIKAKLTADKAGGLANKIKGIF